MYFIKSLTISNPNIILNNIIILEIKGNIKNKLPNSNL